MSLLQHDVAAPATGVCDDEGVEEFRPRKLHLPLYLFFSLIVPVGVAVLWRVDAGALFGLVQVIAIVIIELHAYSESSKARILVSPSGIRLTVEGEGPFMAWDEIVDAVHVVNEGLLVFHPRDGDRMEFTPGTFENTERLNAYIEAFLPEHVAVRETRSDAGKPLGALLIVVVTVVAVYVILAVYWGHRSTFWVVLAGLLAGAALALFVLVRFGASSPTCRAVCTVMLVALCAVLALLVLAQALGMLDRFANPMLWHVITCLACYSLGCLVPLLSARILVLQRGARRSIDQQNAGPGQLRL